MNDVISPLSTELGLIGYTRTGKPVLRIYGSSSSSRLEYANFTHQDNQDAINLHEKHYIAKANRRREILAELNNSTLTAENRKALIKEKNNINYALHSHYSEITGHAQHKNFNEDDHISKYPYMTYDYKEKELNKKR